MANTKALEVTVTLRCKIAVCGSATVGKSALISMFTSKGTSFPKDYRMTSGVEVVVAPVHVPSSTTQVELFLLDTAGNDMFADIVPQYWGGAYYALLVYDVTSQESYETAKRWLDVIKSSRPDKERPVRGCLVATRTDMPSSRHVVSTSAARDWASANQLSFFEVSAAPPGKDVESPFTWLAAQVHKAYEEKLRGYVDACRNY